MSETRGLPVRLIRVIRLNQILHRYDLDTKLTVDTDMTETTRPELAQIWLGVSLISLQTLVQASQSYQFQQ